MDQNERRSRVPAGTFGGSAPPAEPAAPSPSGEAADRKRFIDTLTGKEAALSEADVEPEAQPPEPTLPEPAEPRRGVTSTLVGHPQVAPPQPSPSSAPVLSPPKWRGARAYMEGDDPQPRISSIPTPPLAAPVKPVGVAIGVLRSKVTTKVGLPTNTVQPPTPSSDHEPAIDDTIQQMLERQTSVPMQVEEAVDAESIPDLPDGLAILEDPSSPKVKVKSAVSAPPPPPPVSLRPDTAFDADDDTLRPAASEEAEGPLMPSDPPLELVAKVAASTPLANRPAPRKDETPGRRAERASSLSPAELPQRRRRIDQQAGLGLLFVAAMVIIGGGGWLVTRGGYFRSHRRLAAPVATAPANPAPAAPATLPGVPSNLAPPAVPAQAPKPATPAATSSSARSTPARESTTTERSARRETRSERGDKPDEREPATQPQAAEAESAEAAEPSEGATEQPKPNEQPSVLTVKPRAEPSSELPDTPSREDVIAALDPLRPAVNECARGQRGTAQLDITVSSSGQVSHAVVGGDFAGTPEGSCIARAARTAQFTPFKKPRFRVIYPFQL